MANFLLNYSLQKRMIVLCMYVLGLSVPGSLKNLFYRYS